MSKKKECYETESGSYDTGGKPVIVRICYCGTTACKKLPNNDYPLPKDYEAVKNHYSQFLKGKLV